MMDMKKRKMYTYGGLAEAEEKTTRDYDGGEQDGEGFAHGGMPKKKVIHAHEVAKKSMPEFEKEYGKEKGKQIAYATAMKNEKLHMSGGGYAEGGETKKPAAMMAVLAKLKKPSVGEVLHGGEEGEEEGEGMGSSMDEGHMMAAEEMMDAMKSGDKGAFVRSLKNFIRMCSYGEEE